KSMRRHGADERDGEQQNRRPLRKNLARRLRRQDQNDQNCWQQKSRRFPVVEDEIKQIRQRDRSRDRGHLPRPFPLAHHQHGRQPWGRWKDKPRWGTCPTTRMSLPAASSTLIGCIAEVPNNGLRAKIEAATSSQAISRRD